MTPQEFVDKWRRSKLTERSAAQSHFNDLCRMLGQPTPAKADPEGATFTFEKGVDKRTGGHGWADVWKKGCFAWEYKGKHKNLNAAYEQLQLYRDALLNPPLLVVSDMETIVIHTNFTNTVKRTFTLTFDDLLTKDGLQTLRNAFEHPDRLRAEQTPEGVTRQAAAEFSKLAESLRQAGHDPEKAAHFLIRILFCLFAEDIRLLPEGLFSRMIEDTKDDPDRCRELMEQLFGHMAGGGFFGLDRIPHFNGGIFDSSDALPLGRDDLEILARVSRLDWSSIEPSILGTLFERGLDPGKRAQLGAHYTSREDILLIVEPVLMRPLRRRWEEVRKHARELAAKWRQADSAGGAKTRARRRLEKLLYGFADEIAATTVLDPACGSGNFLYVALRQMLDLEKDVIRFATDLGLPMFFPTVKPEQLYGIEINEYAHELAQATIWIGYIQWLRENGFGQPSEPILKALDNIHEMDAILAFDEDGNPVEPEWPEADVAIGNPPFLGDKKMRAELGDTYTEILRDHYRNRLPGGVDLCCYWLEKARAMIEGGRLKRAGLLATQGIRGGANRVALDRIKKTGDIFWAQSDRNWILEGAAVHVSMVGFDKGAEELRELDGKHVRTINANLTASLDTTGAARLPENTRISYVGPSPKAPFDIPGEVARSMLESPPNPIGRTNSDVVRPIVSAIDLAKRNRGLWTIDFGLLPMEAAAQYEEPFEYVKLNVLPVRMESQRAMYRQRWWQYARPRVEMREALEGLRRFISTPRYSKHRFFVWLNPRVLSNDNTVVFAREDDYFFGVLHSRVHELWARRQGTQLREAESGFRYTPTTCFETFPFPWPPGEELTEDRRVQEITAAAKELVEKRERWVNPDGASEAELKKRTLTNLYNQRPTWLDLAHKKLDDAVLDAYGWPHDITGDHILERLLALNLERAQKRSD
ncbi:class I SAM-dependent DNA methyltransferase [Candidatus Bipolaricaulota bacterium]|nr:class I SAM-dependent DNA methyltransferase [Candidatus Bipolaricaulota bacterium]